MFPDFGYIPIDEVKAYPAPPLDVEMGGGQVMICIVIIGTSIGAKVAYYHMGCSTLACHDPLQTIWESLLMESVLFEDISECIAVMHVVLVQHNDHGKMHYLLHHNSLQAMEIGVMTPESLVDGHQVAEIQAPLRIFHVQGNHIQYAMQDQGFLEFLVSTALQDVGSKVVLPQSFHKGCILLPKVVNAALALLEPACCFAIGAFGAWGRLVQTPRRRRVRHWGLVKGTLVKDFLLQVHDWGKHQIMHLLIFWFFS